MKISKLVKAAAVPMVLGVVASVVAGAYPASAASERVPASPVKSIVSEAGQPRQLLGQVAGSGPTYLEASAHTAGIYAVEYDIKGTAFYDTYVNDVELGYVGGGTGIYRTRPVSLSAGGHLVKIPGVEGSATASVYLVQIS
ncbi:hypothetical protein [Streptomyces cinereospinus]|uniref:Uncharacterized protein n=1 Tax=Streptomyces cinereospinus TaxID=285561 RepID=A0ABV5N5U2_9ACTN